MKRLLMGGTVVNVFTGTLEREDVLIEDDRIVGVGEYTAADADSVEDVTGKFICPGLIDGHIHIESTMLTPTELAKLCMPHGTTAIVADPHEIANVCGTDGIRYMLEASRGLPLHVYIAIPSCVPATPFDESGAVLHADDIEPFYGEDSVVGLAEMMNYPGVLAKDPDVMAKLAGARRHGKVIDGHAPFLSGKALDAYIAQGIQSDHECSNLDEALEKLKRGQWIMVREGTAARNLEALLPLFDEPYCQRAILVTDDRHPADLMRDGHIDNIIRLAVQNGKSAVTAIQMATLRAAQCFGLHHVGAVAPGYRADLVVLDRLESFDVCDVYSSGVKVVDNRITAEIAEPKISDELRRVVGDSFHLSPLSSADFHIEEKGKLCRVIGVLAGQLVTTEEHIEIDWTQNNGVDTDRDILKLAVIERHHRTGHRGVGFIRGIGLKKGAIASSVSHDSHNVIVIGTNEQDMAIAANRICQFGGNVVVVDGEIVAEMQLPIAGLMTDRSGSEIAAANERVRAAVADLGAIQGIEPFMNMAFVSLSVIPSLKMTTQGLVDVDRQIRVSLYVE